MSLTTNQGLIIADPTDVNDVPASMNDLVTGGVTPANAMENRLVQRFLSAVDRTARNPTPFEGELSWLSDVNQYEYYNGTAWAPFQGTPQQAYNAVGGAALNNPTYIQAGITLTGVAIVVPLSGILRCDYSATIDNSAANIAYISPQLNTGGVVGAGATITAASDDTAIRKRGTDEVNTSGFVFYTGLTPGATVNAFLMWRTSGAAATYATLRISLEPK